MMVHKDVFKNYGESYGKNLRLQFINQNEINQNLLKVGYYYGLSIQGIIPHLSSQWTTYHIVRYDGHHNGFINIYYLFSLYHKIDINGLNGYRNIFWTTGIENNNHILSNLLFYQLNKNITHDMILADETITDDRKNELIAELNNNETILELRESVLTCSICAINPLNRVLICGHTLCNVCSTHPSYNTCHMCRIPIDQNNDIRPLFIS